MNATSKQVMGELKSALRQGTLILPYSVAISYHLLEDWFDENGERLAELTVPT